MLFIVQKNKIHVWSYISVEDLGQIVCDGLHVLGLYVFIYAMHHIYSINRLLDMGRKTMLKLLLSLGKWSIMPCHGFGENVKPGADALKQTLKAITYVICIMQHNASALT